MDGGTERQRMGKQTYSWMDEHMVGQIDRQTDEWRDEMNEWTVRWMVGWVERLDWGRVGSPSPASSGTPARPAGGHPPPGGTRPLSASSERPSVLPAAGPPPSAAQRCAAGGTRSSTEPPSSAPAPCEFDTSPEGEGENGGREERKREGREGGKMGGGRDITCAVTYCFHQWSGFFLRFLHFQYLQRRREGGREGGREGEREGGREGEKEGGREGGRERGREGGREGCVC